ncbi:hypothetical protein F383_18841 [Gossypium arboreum]|uniref:Uncharacterized protein n=1 Tax=Gossypium arboreum TaxID=29729 RepID=A0A0B0NU60_GOSAR|nr:hypothetical protein F383_18841 [Gossypium arboreum]
MVRLPYFFYTSLLSYIAYSVLFSMFYSVTKLARVGDYRSSHHIINLLFWLILVELVVSLYIYACMCNHLLCDVVYKCLVNG